MAFVSVQRAFFALNLWTRVLLAVLLPLIGMLWLAGTSIVEEWHQLHSTRALLGVAELSRAYSEAVHELQKERGTSAGFLGAKGTTFGERLIAQRQATDERLVALTDVITRLDPDLKTTTLAEAMIRAGRTLDGLADIRRQVSALAISPADEIAYFTRVIGGMIDVVGQVASLSRDRDVSNAVSAYVAIIKAKERVGQERAVGSAAFSAGQFSPTLYRRFVELGGEQGAYFDQFFVYATAELADHWREAMQGPVIDEHDRLRRIALGSLETGKLEPIDPTHWFDVTTARIDSLKEMEDTVGIHVQYITEEHLDEAKSVFTTVVGLLVGLFLLSIVAAMVIAHDLVRSLTGMAAAMAALADRQLDVDIPASHRRDEIGTMAAALAVFRDSMVEARRLEAEQDEQRRVREAHAERLEELSQRFEMTATAVVGKAMKGAGTIREVAGRLGAGVGKTGAQSLDVAEVTERTVINVATVGRLISHLSESIGAITGQVDRSLGVAEDAVTEASRANEIVRGLAAAVTRIGSVVRMITEIASQTDLLALNATVEAARAGEMGKGFAVVAGEVKALANQTSKATDDITAQIANLQVVSEDAVNAIEAITAIINGVSHVANDIAEAVDQQRAAIDEISTNTDAMANDTALVQESVTTMTQSSAMSHALAVEVIWAAGDLGDWLGPFGHEMNWFLTQMKAA